MRHPIRRIRDAIGLLTQSCNHRFAASIEVRFYGSGVQPT